MSILTLGHSTHDQAKFAELCHVSPAPTTVIDTRSHPGSNHVPHFNRQDMKKWLPMYGLEYEWWPDLGGWGPDSQHYAAAMAEYGVDITAYTHRGVFPKDRIGVERPELALANHEIGERPNVWWNRGLHDYSWWTSTPEFQSAVDQLLHYYGQPEHHAILVCAEARWDKCHRQMIADYIERVYDRPVFHIKSFVPKRPSTLRYVRHRDVVDLEQRIDRYDPIIRNSWFERESVLATH